MEAGIGQAPCLGGLAAAGMNVGPDHNGRMECTRMPCGVRPFGKPAVKAATGPFGNGLVHIVKGRAKRPFCPINQGGCDRYIRLKTGAFQPSVELRRGPFGRPAGLAKRGGLCAAF